MEEVGLYHYGARWYDPAGAHFTQADTLVPSSGDPLSYNRYAYTRYNPISRIDPSGHMDAEFGGGGCQDPVTCRQQWLQRRSEEILVTYGHTDDASALNQIFDAAESIYGTYDRILPALTGILNNVEESNVMTIYHASVQAKNGCAGLGRNPEECEANEKSGQYFKDTGFHKDFLDGHNQIFHVWPYISTSAATDISLFYPYNVAVGLTVSVTANLYHEIGQPGSQSTWEDYYLSERGMVLGIMAASGMIPPEHFGDVMEFAIGDGGPGSFGMVPLMRWLMPLSGNR